MVQAINCRAVTVVRYAAGKVDWTKEELQIVGRKTRKLMILSRLYIMLCIRRLILTGFTLKDQRVVEEIVVEQIVR